MRLAWFAARSAGDVRPFDDTPSLVAELESRYEIARYDERRALDFVWQHWRNPFDLCVYEITDTAASAFVWPYVVHYPGVLRLRSSDLHRSRAAALHRTHRADDHAAEIAFAGYDAIRIPLVASRLTVVGDAYAAALLEDEHPGTRVRHAPNAVAAPARAPGPHRAIPRFVIATPSTAAIAARAAQRAREAGSDIEIADGRDVDALVDGDVVIALDWPPAPELPVTALTALAAGRPVIVYEATATAVWNTLDPQTWQPRSLTGGTEPMAISIDPLDDEHSLMLAIRRLAADASLCERLGRAGEQWWRMNATLAHAATAWDGILAEAAITPPLRRPADWPAHLAADGTARARELLGEMGVRVDFL